MRKKRIDEWEDADGDIHRSRDQSVVRYNEMNERGLKTVNRIFGR
jgi:hypothetical protein